MHAASGEATHPEGKHQDRPLPGPQNRTRRTLHCLSRSRSQGAEGDSVSRAAVPRNLKFRIPMRGPGTR